MWGIFLGNDFQRLKQDLRSYKTIYAQAVKEVPILANELLLILQEQIVLADLSAKVKKVQNLINKYDIDVLLNYLMHHKHLAEKDRSKNKIFLIKGYAESTDNYKCSFGISNYFNILHILAILGDVVTIEKLHVKGFNIDIRGPGLLTPLHVAVMHDQSEVIETLIKLNANKETRTELLIFDKSPRMCPMELAAYFGKYKFLDRLYTEIVRVGVDLGGMAECIKNPYFWKSEIFFDILLRHFIEEIKKTTGSTSSLFQIYKVKKEISEKNWDNIEKADEELKQILGVEVFAKIKTIDFFIDRQWAVPGWFEKILEEVDLQPCEQPQKIMKIM